MLQRAVVSGLVITPIAAGVFALVQLWSHGIGWFDLGLAIAMYAVTGFGIAIG
ncbi:MAG TPA: hypothetical protein VNG12_14510 [Acidimicrobiales bacterium]|nr:hypothetical protein [Acidimicrobiales bacterium]